MPPRGVDCETLPLDVVEGYHWEAEPGVVDDMENELCLRWASPTDGTGPAVVDD